MGDRGNIVVLEHNEGKPRDPDQIWFYGHWSGSQMPQILQTGLKDGQGRWDDDGYLARIIFCRLIPAKQLLTETGYGIYTRISDNEHPVLVCDCPRQRVFIVEEEELADGRIPAAYEPKPDKVWTFKEYCDLTTDKLPWN